MKKILQLLIILFASVASTFGQDIHFSHIHANPLLINPSLIGLYDADMRLIADYRQQWQSVTTNYRTMYASVDTKTRAQFRRNSAFGFGLELFSDVAGDLDFKTQGVHFSASGIQTLDGYQGRKVITAGIKMGFVSNSFDITKIQSIEQEPELLNGIDNQTIYMDWSLGLTWLHEFKKNKHSYYVGLSAAHINRPEVAFGFNVEDQPEEILFPRVILHGGGDFKISSSQTILPSFIFLDQGPHREITMGTFWKYRTINKGIHKKKDVSIYLGAWARWYAEVDDVRGFDALITAVRVNYFKTTFTFSYDINMSSLALASTGRGGAEISVVHLLDWRNKFGRKVRCPAVEW